jgi:hypothetical protein
MALVENRSWDEPLPPSVTAGMKHTVWLPMDGGSWDIK